MNYPNILNTWGCKSNKVSILYNLKDVAIDKKNVLFYFIGRCHDQRPGLPDGVGPTDQQYGLPTLRDCAAGELINPLKTWKQVKDESLKNRDLYQKSHNAYDVGMCLWIYCLPPLNVKDL